MRTYLSIFLILFSLLLSSCSNSDGYSSADSSQVAKVIIEPSAVLLSDPDQSKMLHAVAYDANGNVLKRTVSWTSSHSDIVAIGADGNATAQGIIGSTTVTAEVDGVESAQVMILVAELVGNAITVDDDQVVGDIEAVDPNDLPGIGYRYTVALQNISPPTIGSIIVGTGAVPIAGQVIDTETKNGMTKVTVEVVPIDQVFAQLEIHEDYDLSKVDMQVNDDLSSYYTMQTQSDGSYLWELKDGVSPSVSSRSPNASASILSLLSCSYDGSGVFPLALSMPATYQLSNNLHTAVDFSMGVGHMKAFVYGDMSTEFKVAPTFTTALTGKVSCELKLGTLPIPISGVISFFFGLQVPLGIGIEAGGELDLAQLSLEATSKTVYDVAFGLDCSSGTCIGLNQMQDRNSTFEMKWVLPSGDVNDDLRLKPEVSGFGFAKLEFHAAGLQDPLELIGAKGGLSQGADLALIPAQCVNNSYQSDYKLSLFISVASGNDVNQFLSLFPVLSFNGFEYKISTDLATSPKVLKAVANKEEYHTDDTVKFTVELDPNTVNYGFLGYNIDKVSIYRRTSDGQGRYNYTWFFDMPATNGQTRFEYEWRFTDDGTIEDNYFAFVDTYWLPNFGDFGILELAPISIEFDNYTKTRECTEDGGQTTDRWSWTYIPDENKTIEDHNNMITTYVTTDQYLTPTKYMHITNITYPDGTTAVTSTTYDKALPVIHPLIDNIDWDFTDYVYSPHYTNIPKHLLSDGNNNYAYGNAQVIRTINSLPEFSDTFTYDAAFNIIKRIRQDNGYTKTYEYTYDISGNVTKYKEIRDTCTNTTTASYQYDAAGNIIKIDNSTDNGCGSVYTQTQNIIFSYDQYNNMTSELVTYVEDTADPDNSTYHGTRIVTYSYDNLGNMLSKDMSQGGDGEVFATKSSSESYAYIPDTHHMIFSSVNGKACTYSDTRW